MVLQLGLTDEAALGHPSSGELFVVNDDVAMLRTAIVNVFFLGGPGGSWVLVDCGIAGYADTIAKAAAERFGADARPDAIVLTHGHFDHVGALEALAERLDVPVFAHQLEHPFLDGSQSYPPPDPTAGGGLMTLLSPLFPRSPTDVGERLRALPDDGTVPYLDGWRWIHTPGHTPGHVSLWHQGQSVLVAGDACITTGQESVYKVATQSVELHGPPRYFTPDWDAAEASVRRLAQLPVQTLVTGHGPPLGGPSVAPALHELAARFGEIARPHGKARA